MSIRYKKSDGSIITIPTGGSSDSSEWFGTTAELEEQFDSIPNGTKINILDDDDGNTIQKEIDAINENLTASDNLQFKFGKDGDGNYGYYGADGSLIPFKSGAVELHSKVYTSGTLSDTYTFTEDYEKILVFASSANDSIGNVQFSLVPTIQGTATTLMSYDNSSGGGIAGYASVLLLENVKANDTIAFSGRYCSLWTIYQI